MSAGRPATAGALGIMGGTFDPIHLAHLAAAQAALEELELSGVHFVPVGIPPHKPDQVISPPADRVAMVELAIADNPAFRLSRVEVDRPGPSYAVETVQLLLADPPGGNVPDNGFVFILSAEALGGLPTWREPQRLLAMCRLAVVPRLGSRAPGRPWLAEHFPGQEERVIVLEGPSLGHSATQIRALAAAGRSIRYLVPPAVEAYIRDHQLYQPDLWRKN
ncbi:MAG TPA: nicotinate-nucleotide adenylyltransferase [Candidatus Limnocylindrales bacterium]|nr:nicotinate-nucleotide adenylyltransferase [Candidatus Limnocylindrales bacterium]